MPRPERRVLVLVLPPRLSRERLRRRRDHESACRRVWEFVDEYGTPHGYCCCYSCCFNLHNSGLVVLWAIIGIGGRQALGIGGRQALWSRDRWQTGHLESGSMADRPSGKRGIRPRFVNGSFVQVEDVEEVSRIPEEEIRFPIVNTRSTSSLSSSLARLRSAAAGSHSIMNRWRKQKHIF